MIVCSIQSLGGYFYKYRVENNLLLCPFRANM